MCLLLAHTQTADSSIYATYVPTILQLLMWLTKLYIAQNAAALAHLNLAHLKEPHSLLQMDIRLNPSCKFGTNNHPPQLYHTVVTYVVS